MPLGSADIFSLYLKNIAQAVDKETDWALENTIVDHYQENVTLPADETASATRRKVPPWYRNSGGGR